STLPAADSKTLIGDESTLDFIHVKDETEPLCYAPAPHEVDLPGDSCRGRLVRPGTSRIMRRCYPPLSDGWSCALQGINQLMQVVLAQTLDVGLQRGYDLGNAPR